MKVLVTGHEGYIGSVLAPILVAAGHEVTGLDVLLYADDPSFAPSKRIDLRDVDVSDLLGYDAVVHLAGLSNDPLGELDPALTGEINLDATLNLAKAAKQSGVRRFVFASSCSMYGSAGVDRAVTEDSPLRPLTAYAESKVRSEEGLALLADPHFSPVFMRNATAYGVSPRLRLDLVLNNLVAWAFTTKTIRIMSDGSPWRPLIHVEDISRSVAAVLNAPVDKIHNQAFNIGADGENYQVRTLADIVSATVPECGVRYTGAIGADPRSYRVDFGKFARTFPDFRLTWDVRSGASQLLETYHALGLTLEDFEGPKYNRLKYLTSLTAAGRLDQRLRPVRGPVTNRS